MNVPRITRGRPKRRGCFGFMGVEDETIATPSARQEKAVLVWAINVRSFAKWSRALPSTMLTLIKAVMDLRGLEVVILVLMA